MSRPTSFYYAFLSLSRRQREAIVAVWDFCRAVDDTVDEAGTTVQRAGFREQGPESEPERDVVRAQLQAWRAELNACYEGQATTRQGRALQPWIERYQLTRQSFEDLIDGVEMDLDHARYATFDELYEYCWRVASTVGFMCLEIFGVRDAGRDYALNLGLALQLTNILRDVGADLRAGRVYLPTDDLATHGYSPDRLDWLAERVARHGASALDERFRDLMRDQIGRARAHYARGMGGVARLPADCRLAIHCSSATPASVSSSVHRRGGGGGIAVTGAGAAMRRIRATSRPASWRISPALACEP